MDPDWNDSQPIYRQIRDRVVDMILDGLLREGDPLPSVRTVATDTRVNPLTVLKAYQRLTDEKLVEKRRGLGMFVNAGARELLLQAERERFLAEQWPQTLATIRRLGLTRSAARTGRTEPMACIEARGLRKAYKSVVALDGVDLTVGAGRILGLIGPNGAGKSTALQAILGLIPYQGELTVLGRNPWRQRDRLMAEVCFIADVAVLPRWLRVSQALDYMAGVHPRFDRAKAERFLAKTTIRRASRVRELSKGMVAQLHLALVMAVDAKLLVLDEPTLGLDLVFRKQFYDTLLSDYFDGEPHHRGLDPPGRGDPAHPHRRGVPRSRPHRAGLQHGGLRGALPGGAGRARRSWPRRGRCARSTSASCSAARLMIFDGVPREQLAALGEVRTPSLADLFMALMGGGEPAQGAAA